MSEFYHVSVLLDECIDGLNIKPDGIYVDGTLGGAGHSSQIAKRLTTGRLIGIDRDPVALKAASERLAPYMDRVTLVHSNFCEIASVLKELKDRGASLNVLTASPHLMLDPCLKRLELWDLFDNIWSCDDFHTTKTDPEIYRRAAERLNTTVDKVLFLDDNLDADRSAKAAGVLTCGVYDASSADYVEEMKEVNDFYIYDFSQLPDLPIHEKA